MYYEVRKFTGSVKKEISDLLKEIKELNQSNKNAGLKHFKALKSLADRAKSCKKLRDTDTRVEALLIECNIILNKLKDIRAELAYSASYSFESRDY